MHSAFSPKKREPKEPVPCNSRNVWWLWLYGDGYDSFIIGGVVPPSFISFSYHENQLREVNG